MTLPPRPSSHFVHSSEEVGGAPSVDVEGAPGPKQIKHILEKQVLPRFLNAFVSEEKPADAKGGAAAGPDWFNEGLIGGDGCVR